MINATVDACDSDMGQRAVYHDNRVRVDKASELDARFRPESAMRCSNDAEDTP